MAGNRRLMLGAVMLLVVGTLGAFLVFKATGGSGGPPPAPPKVKQVLAVEEIPPHITITKAMLKEEETTTPAANVATSIADVEGRISVKQIGKGTAVARDSYAASASDISIAQFEVPEGKRALAIMVDPEQGVGGLVARGDFVDIIVYYKEGTDTVSRIVTQDIEVLATEKTVTPPPPPAPAGADAKGAPPPPAPVKKLVRIILAVTPQDAAQLVAARDKGGDLIPVLRNAKSREVFAQLPEVWEHPHKMHPHYGKGVPDWPYKGGPAPERTAVQIATQTLPAPTVSMPPPPPPGVEVQIIKGTNAPETRIVPR